ncbi:MAG: preprotein translocase subunit SecE [Pseudomonadota bacterium]
MANPAEFIAQVRSEAAKVVWPTRKEAGLTTVMVFFAGDTFRGLLLSGRYGAALGRGAFALDLTRRAPLRVRP